MLYSAAAVRAWHASSVEGANSRRCREARATCEAADGDPAVDNQVGEGADASQRLFASPRRSQNPNTTCPVMNGAQALAA